MEWGIVTANRTKAVQTLLFIERMLKKRQVRLNSKAIGIRGFNAYFDNGAHIFWFNPEIDTSRGIRFDKVYVDKDLDSLTIEKKIYAKMRSNCIVVWI